jgi:hypothetical protein
MAKYAKNHQNMPKFNKNQQKVTKIASNGPKMPEKSGQHGLRPGWKTRKKSGLAPKRDGLQTLVGYPPLWVGLQAPDQPENGTDYPPPRVGVPKTLNFGMVGTFHPPPCPPF